MTGTKKNRLSCGLFQQHHVVWTHPVWFIPDALNKELVHRTWHGVLAQPTLTDWYAPSMLYGGGKVANWKVGLKKKPVATPTMVGPLRISIGATTKRN